MHILAAGIGMKSRQISTKASRDHVSEPRLAAPWGVSLGLGAAAPAGLPPPLRGQCGQQKERAARRSVSGQQGLRAPSASCGRLAPLLLVSLLFYCECLRAGRTPQLPTALPSPCHLTRATPTGSVSAWPLPTSECEGLS